MQISYTKNFQVTVAVCFTTLLLSLNANAARCNVDGTWYDYSNPKCSARKGAPTDSSRIGKDTSTNTKDQNVEAQLREIEAKQGFSMTRVYRSSSLAHRVVLKTNKNRRIKCVISDKHGIPQAVSEATITPPVDEIIIMTGNVDVHSVQCFPAE